MNDLRPALFAVASAFALAACSGSTAITVGSDAPDAGSDSGAAPDAGVDAVPDSGTGPVADAASATDAAPDGATDVDAGPVIDPIVVGNTWTNAVTEVGYYPLCPSGTHDAKVLGTSTRDGRLAYEVTSFCTGVGSLYYAEDGDVVYWDDAGTWLLGLDAPVVDGHTWTNGVSSYTWHDVGSVTVPAGTFAGCFKAQDNGGPSFTVFCRGVGPVQWSYRDSSGLNGYDATLTAKSF